MNQSLFADEESLSPGSSPGGKLSVANSVIKQPKGKGEGVRLGLRESLHLMSAAGEKRQIMDML